MNAVAFADVFPPRVFFPMFPRAGHTTHQVAHSLEIEPAIYFPLDHPAHQGRLALFLGSRAALERVTLRFGEPNSESAIHIRNLAFVRQVARHKPGSEAKTSEIGGSNGVME